MGSPVSSALRAARVAELSGQVRRLVPPPLPPAPPAPRVGGYNAGSGPHQQRFEEFLRRAESAPAPADGTTRLYRVGEIATNYKPPETVRLYGRDMPYAEFVSMREQALSGGFNTNPQGAAGRWATDAPKELDFYVGDNDLDAPIYRFDVPASEVPQYNVSKTPFSGSSRNHEREFVLPDQHLKNAVRIMAVPAAVGVGAASQGQGVRERSGELR